MLTFERVVVAPVWEDTVLDLLVETFLHAIHILQLVLHHPLVLSALTPLDRLLHRGGSSWLNKRCRLINFCHDLLN